MEKEKFNNLFEKEFEFYDEDDDVALNRSGIYDSKRYEVSFTLGEKIREFENGNWKGDEIKSIDFQLFFNPDPTMKGRVEDCYVSLNGYDDSVKIIRLKDIDPEEFYWIGKAFLKIAQHFDVDERDVERRNKKGER